MTEAVRIERAGPSELRRAALVFAAALAVHAGDHFRRGMHVLTNVVEAAGYFQIGLSIVTIVLVMRGHRLAAGFALGLGAASAIGFTAAHLLPEWSVFSDSFIDPPGAHHVTWFSWFAAAFEIGAGSYLAFAGYRATRAAGG
jgi:hypothetical protein